MSTDVIETEKPKGINSLRGLKVICVILILWWHLPILKSYIDIGARTCEFLFVVSGFLVGYNAFNKIIPATIEESLKYVGKKLIYFYPLHVITMLIIWIFVYESPRLTVKNVFLACLNLLLVQAWGPYHEVHFSFNGPSWFLSALMFCYFFAPFLLKITKKIKQSTVVFIFAFIIHYGIEMLVKYYPDIFFWIDLHTFPVLRLLEFCMGMSMVPLFMYVKEHYSIVKNVYIMTVVEVITLLYSLFLIIIYNPAGLRSMFSVLMCIIVFIFAFDSGEVSKILSFKPFGLFSKIEFEFYLLHSPLIKCLYPKNMSPVLINWYETIIIFIIIIITSIIYMKIFKPLFAKYLKKIYNWCCSRLDYNLTTI